jgi:hypothetical protein
VKCAAIASTAGCISTRFTAAPARCTQFRRAKSADHAREVRRGPPRGGIARDRRCSRAISSRATRTLLATGRRRRRRRPTNRPRARIRRRCRARRRAIPRRCRTDRRSRVHSLAGWGPKLPERANERRRQLHLGRRRDGEFRLVEPLPRQQLLPPYQVQRW